MGCAIIVAGAVISLVALIDRQFVLFQAWDIAITFAAALLISVIPFGMAVILARLEKLEQLQKDDYDLLERKYNALQKATKSLHSEISENAKVNRMLYEGTSMAKPDERSIERPVETTSEIGTIDEFFEAVRGEQKSASGPSFDFMSAGSPPAIQPYVPASQPIPLPPPSKTYNGMAINKIVRVGLLSAGIGFLLFSAYYFFQVVFNDLWGDTAFRTAQLVMFFGGVIFLTLGRILKNQEKIIHLSMKRRNGNGKDAGLIEKKHIHKEE